MTFLERIKEWARTREARLHAREVALADAQRSFEKRSQGMLEAVAKAAWREALNTAARAGDKATVAAEDCRADVSRALTAMEIELRNLSDKGPPL